MFNRKKRKDTTYLKMRDGKVINAHNPYPTGEEELVSLEEQQFNNFNEEVEKQNDTPEKKKTKFLFGIGLIFILIPFIIIGLNVGKSYLYQIKEYMILGTDKTITNNKDNETSDISEIKDIENQDNNNTTGWGDKVISITNQTKATEILEITNIVNTSMTTSYNGLKSDIFLFVNNQDSLYSTTNKLKTRKDIIEKNKNLIENSKTLLVKYNQEELYDMYVNRFDLILDTIETLQTDLSRSTAINITNEAINNDNVILDNELELLRNFLIENDIEFTEEDNNISLI